MARVLEANGAKVVREYYFNDHGEQINRFAKSLVAAWAEANKLGGAGYQTETPCDGYKGAYINEIAARVEAEAKADGVNLTALAHQDQGLNDDGEPLGEDDTEVREEFRKRAVPMMFDEIQKSMKDFRVNFDVWFHENSLYADKKVEAAIEELKSHGDIYDKDGATWFESTKHGDDKDRVIIKSNGEFAYFAADIAYYWDKRHRAENPADVAIYMLGADHHGYIGRMMAMCAAFGDEPGKNMQILIGQLVNVMKDNVERVVPMALTDPETRGDDEARMALEIAKNPEPARAAARLKLNDAVQQVIANGLDLLGVTAPEKM